MLFVVLFLASFFAVNALPIDSGEHESLSVEIPGSVVRGCEALDVEVDSGGSSPYARLSNILCVDVESEPLVFELENDSTTEAFGPSSGMSGSIDTSGRVRADSAPSDNPPCLRNAPPMSMAEILLRVLGSWIHAVRAQMGMH